MADSARPGENSKADQASRPATYQVDGRAVAARALPPGLYLVATPIGNLGDISLRALETLAAADLIACEDTRVTARLLERYAIATSLTPYHDHNAAAARPKILARIRDGAAVALVSDAGTPLVSDPGFRLVQAARDADLAVTAVPGASAVLTALAVAGLPTDRFFFEGFLPVKDAGRRTRIAELARIPATLVLFESGPRIAPALAALADGLGDRPAAVCRELTKLHEEVRRDGLAALARHYADGAETRGEFVLVVAPPQAATATPAEIDALLRDALRSQSLRDAVGAVAAATGEPRSEVYRRALALAKDTP
jgi:16S rRNA (cytidine1402-2'-O)-methyltransferase